jgi:hypothetical protein
VPATAEDQLRRIERPGEIEVGANWYPDLISVLSGRCDRQDCESRRDQRRGQDGRHGGTPTSPADLRNFLITSLRWLHELSPPDVAARRRRPVELNP